MCAEVSDKAPAVYRVQSNETCPSLTGTSESFRHLTESVDSVWTDVGLLGISRRAGLGCAGVVAGFRLSQGSSVWELYTGFMQMEEANAEVQYLFSWLHLMSLNTRVSWS